MGGFNFVFVLQLSAVLWMLVLYLIPLFVVFGNSFSNFDAEGAWGLKCYIEGFVGEARGRVLLRTLKNASLTVVSCFVIGYPVAYYIATRKSRQRDIFFFLLTLPLFVNYIIRLASVRVLLRDGGIFAEVFNVTGLIYTNEARIMGLVYGSLFFFILPTYIYTRRVYWRYSSPARDLYATPTKLYLHITLPLSSPGIITGCLLVFITAFGDYLAPEMFSTTGNYLGQLIYSQFIDYNDYERGSAISMSVLLLFVIATALLSRSPILKELVSP